LNVKTVVLKVAVGIVVALVVNEITRRREDVSGTKIVPVAGLRG
jgi:hypothetical protein